MLGRLLIGIAKGLLLGFAIGFALVRLGDPAPGPLIAYLAAAISGILVGLIAGKPIWAKDAKIEAGMKAFVGALLGAGLMYAARRFLTMPLPISLGALSAANESLGEAAHSAGTVGGLAVTSLSAIAALLGGFYEVDNDPHDAEATAQGSKKLAASSGRRIGAASANDDLDADLDVAADEKRAKK